VLRLVYKRTSSLSFYAAQKLFAFVLFEKNEPRALEMQKNFEGTEER
jgi:hypothetical protein